MKLHHDKHHQTYVTSYNTAVEKLHEAGDSPKALIELGPLINFHGGGHINHSLFWENLAPRNSGGGDPPTGKLATAIQHAFGGLEPLKKVFNAKLAGIQGSGWAWLVKDTETGGISVKTYAVSLDPEGDREGNNRKNEASGKEIDYQLCRAIALTFYYFNSRIKTP